MEDKGIKVLKGVVKATINSTLENIRDEVKTDGKVSLLGFGTCKRETRSARTGRNPASGKSMEIPEKNVAKFKPSLTFLD